MFDIHNLYCHCKNHPIAIAGCSVSQYIYYIKQHFICTPYVLSFLIFIILIIFLLKGLSNLAFLKLIFKFCLVLTKINCNCLCSHLKRIIVLCVSLIKYNQYFIACKLFSKTCILITFICPRHPYPFCMLSLCLFVYPSMGLCSVSCWLAVYMGPARPSVKISRFTAPFRDLSSFLKCLDFL